MNGSPSAGDFQTFLVFSHEFKKSKDIEEKRNKSFNTKEM